MRYTLEFTKDRRHVAICECGWRSKPMPTAGLAGSAFDTHKEKSHG